LEPETHFSNSLRESFSCEVVVQVLKMDNSDSTRHWVGMPEVFSPKIDVLATVKALDDFIALTTQSVVLLLQGLRQVFYPDSVSFLVLKAVP
jgi:hypothetical protein